MNRLLPPLFLSFTLILAACGGPAAPAVVDSGAAPSPTPVSQPGWLRLTRQPAHRRPASRHQRRPRLPARPSHRRATRPLQAGASDPDDLVEGQGRAFRSVLEPDVDRRPGGGVPCRGDVWHPEFAMQRRPMGRRGAPVRSVGPSITVTSSRSSPSMDPRSTSPSRVYERRMAGAAMTASRTSASTTGRRPSHPVRGLVLSASVPQGTTCSRSVSTMA